MKCASRIRCCMCINYSRQFVPLLLTRQMVELQINISSSDAPMLKKVKFIRAPTAMMMRAPCPNVPARPSVFTCRQVAHVTLQNALMQKSDNITLRMEVRKIPVVLRSVPMQKLVSFTLVSRAMQTTALSVLASVHYRWATISQKVVHAR